MLEIRKDYVLDRWVILSEKRETRPRQFKKIEIKEESFCFFCQGNEHTTPREIGRIEENGKWKIRWFPNKYPTVLNKGAPKLSESGLYHHGYAYGYHEVIVETSDHKEQIADMNENHLKDVLKVYALRIKELSAKKGVKYVVISKNEGVEGGTSLIHPHSQVIAYNKIPKLISEESKASIKNRKCEYCRVIKKEAKSERFVKENKNFVAFCPYASRFNYEVWIFPKKHIKNITEFDEEMFMDLASLLKHVMGKIKDITSSYNYFLHYAPKGRDLHFHMEICPRIATWGGFELSSDDTINSVSPEKAAKFYR